MKIFFSLLMLVLLTVVPMFSKAKMSWEEKTPVPLEGRENPYELDPTTQKIFERQGRLHMLNYPVVVTGLLPPYQAIKNVVESNDVDFFQGLLKLGFKIITKIKNLNGIFQWVGMHSYPSTEGEGVFYVPFKDGQRPDVPMGLTLIPRHGAMGFTISCAECHAGNLFGRPVIGLTNRFPRANHAFAIATFASQHYSAQPFQKLSHATESEMNLMNDTHLRLRSVGAIKPLVLGLDTSLAQVALSLSRRAPDSWATREPYYETHPRSEILANQPADSKPAVWWNLKYKNRWLSDGSVLSGNPIFTNILWNEIGRGADLDTLQKWLHENPQTIAELTTAVFATQAPHWTDYFPPESIHLETAKAGEKLFNQRCSGCHGVYEKNWSHSEITDLKTQLKTFKVSYHEQTPVIDVGTDPNRYLGMSSLEQLNQLEIAMQNGIKVKRQKGYVPPPLVGIWARWPYFHNNSAPSLCAVLTRSSKRPVQYYSGPANDPTTDFDSHCVGYPNERTTPEGWFTPETLYDTRIKGLSNMGHDEGIFLKDSKEVLSPEEKQFIIEYLKTL